MNATVKKFKKKNDINALNDLANGPECDMRDDAILALIAIANGPVSDTTIAAELTLAQNKATDPAVLVELLRIAEFEGRYDLSDAVLGNPNLYASTNADRVLASA